MITIDTDLWGWPQWIMISIWAIVLILTAFLHGKPRTGSHNLGTALIHVGLAAFILSKGGFFGC